MYGQDFEKIESFMKGGLEVSAWREDIGWITFPENQDPAIGKQGPLQRAADFAFFDSVNIFDFLVDGKDIWIVKKPADIKKLSEDLLAALESDGIHHDVSPIYD